MTDVKIPKPVMVDPKLLKMHPKNVKHHDSKQLHDLGVLYEWIGFTDPIIADKDNVVWAGNGSLDAALSKQMALVPVVYMPEEWDDSIKKQFMLMDNRITESAWDADNFKEMFTAISPAMGKIFQTDFTALLEQFNKPESFDIVKVEKELPDKPDDPVSKPGQIYQLGQHFVMCGDALVDLEILTHMGQDLYNKKIQVLITDPPYGLGGYAGRGGKLKPVENDDKDPAIFYNALPTDIPERYIWGNWANIRSIDELPRDVIVWKKNNFGMGKGYRGQYEICLYFGEFKGSDSDVWEVKKDPVAAYKHPTQKPVELILRALRNSSQVNDLVLDCYMGSGTTLIACEQTNRICLGMELDPAYIDVIIGRWENYTGKTAKLVNS